MKMASCPACGSDNVKLGMWPDYRDCVKCGYSFQVQKPVKRDEFGDEIDYNERKADGMW